MTRVGSHLSSGVCPGTPTKQNENSEWGSPSCKTKIYGATYHCTTCKKSYNVMSCSSCGYSSSITDHGNSTVVYVYRCATHNVTSDGYNYHYYCAEHNTATTPHPDV